MSKTYRLNLADAIAPTRAKATGTRGWEYVPELQALGRRRASGVYVITDATSRRVLYVGESHTGRLFDTITRHFREWKIGPGDAQGRRRGGEMYDRFAVNVVWIETPAGEAQDLQYKTIQRLNPRDNVNDGCSDGSCELPV